MSQLDLQKAEEPDVKLLTPAGSPKKQEFLENIYFCFNDYPKAFDCVDNNKLWRILKEMRIPDPPDLPLEKSACRSVNKSYNWTLNSSLVQIGKGVCQGYILSPCFYNLYTECIMRNAGLDEAEAGIKIARRNIKKLRYADNTTFMAESEELKSLFVKVK